MCSASENRKSAASIHVRPISSQRDRPVSWMRLTALEHEDQAEVVHVGTRGPRDDEVVERREEAVAVVVGEQLARFDALRARACERVGREDRARVVLAAVDAVGVARERPCAFLAVERYAEREQELA